jgi:hypothetical protein
MSPKVVKTYQQTFKNNNDLVTEQTFSFTRIYKTKPDQYFRLKVASIFSSFLSTTTIETVNPAGTLTSTETNIGDLFLKGIPELSGLCNYQEKSSASNILVTNNHFYLGSLIEQSGSAEIILDDIPLAPFTIYHHSPLLIVPLRFTVSFIIELLED